MARILVMVLSLALAAGATPGASQSRALALTNVRVVDVAGGSIQAGQTVLIRENRIVAVGPRARTRVPAGARVIDLQGRYLIPGLWDMHVHASDRPVNEPLMAAFGITGFRDMATAPPVLA